jgi:hypothetical protein
MKPLMLVSKHIAALSCVTAAEDEELDYEASFDIRGKNLTASDSKSSKALKHFDTFLESYCEKIKVPPLHHRQLSYYGIKTSGTNEEANIWWDGTSLDIYTMTHTSMETQILKDVSPTGPQLDTHLASRSTSRSSLANAVTLN